MRKITSDSDYSAVNRILMNFYNIHPAGDVFQSQTPAEIVDDYLLYLAVQNFMTEKGLISSCGASKFVISSIGIEVVEKYQGDVRLYLKGKQPEDIRDNFDVYFSGSEKEKDMDKWNKISVFWTVIGIIIGLLSIILGMMQQGWISFP